MHKTTKWSLIINVTFSLYVYMFCCAAQRPRAGEAGRRPAGTGRISLKALKLLVKSRLRLTPEDPAARTAAHPSWISIAGVLAGCGEVAERSKAAVC